jgi:hypothetical protein
MILKSFKSRISKVNLFADYILNQIPKEEYTIIKVVDCGNFFIIKGKTSYNEILDISKIKGDFCERFEINLEGFSTFNHTIDLIEYDCKLKSTSSITHNFFNSENCSYSFKQIEVYKKDSEISYDYCLKVSEIDDDSLVLCSEFPHGHSLEMGRLLYYYGKKITYSIPSTYPFTSIVMTIPFKNQEEDFSVYDNFLEDNDESLKSAILDIFDFDMTDLNKKLKEVDFYDEILNPLSDYDFLKERNKDFFVI